MRLDQGSLIFRKENGECPPWETALGQSQKPDNDYPPYYFKAEGYENILNGILYNSVPLAQISCVFGRKKIFVSAIDSFSNPQNQEIQLAGKFDDIVVHYDGKKRKIKNNPIILLVTKTQDPEKSHFGRRSIKYSPHTKYENITNQDSFDRIQSYYEDRLMCYGFFVEHFDTLHLYCVKAGINYEKTEWDELKLPETDWTDWVDWEIKEKKASQEILNAISKNDSLFKSNPSLKSPSQIIYYGVPGCGKSNKIREKLKDVPEKNKVRVVFHPEYTNAEFIGQILPKVNGHVTYEFTPGPFTQIIKRAYLNPNEQFYLVIEEINRGNAAAIFGDTFQLLDRLKAGETDSLGNDPANASVNTFTEGWSQYFVQNDDVNAYIRETENSIQIGNIRFDSNTAIRLPPNLSILATMNTSDQNVFTLDNAFQRRFDMELVRNEFDLTQPAVNAQYNAEIDDTGIKWGQFWGWINAKITATLKGLSSTEDKRLGVWFVSNVGGIIDDKVFAEKVLKFLWDDVFKFKRPQVFAEGIDTLEKLINSFEKPSEGKERFDVFKDKANLVAFVASPTL